MTRLEPGLFDRSQDERDRFFVRSQVRSEAAFVADGGVESALTTNTFQCVEDFDAHPQTLGKHGRAKRHDHEFLNVDVVVSVLAAVEDVHHRNRQQVRARASDVAVERKSALLGRRASHRQGDSEDRVGAELLLVRGSVGLDELGVDRLLVEAFHAEKRIGEGTFDRLHRLQDAFSAVTPFAVAQLVGLVSPGARTRGDGRSAEDSALEFDVDFHCGVAAGVEDLSTDYVHDLAHSGILPLASPRMNRRTYFFEPLLGCRGDPFRTPMCP